MNDANTEKDDRNLRDALALLVERCPVLAETVYWAGTSAVALEELGHRQSLDLDLHTRRALLDVRPILARLRAAFGVDFELVQPPDEFGSGFRAVLRLPNAARVTIEFLSNYQDVSDAELVPSSTVPSIKRVSLAKYLADKIQCVVERREARDLFDICAVLRRRPDLEGLARRVVAEQDALLMAERLLTWTDSEIADDLEPYSGVNPADARCAGDMLLRWLKSARSQDEPKT